MDRLKEELKGAYEELVYLATAALAVAPVIALFWVVLMILTALGFDMSMVPKQPERY